MIEKFEQQMAGCGYNQEHLIKLLNYSNILQSQIIDTMKEVSLKTVEFTKTKLEKCAKILLKIQEQLTD